MTEQELNDFSKSVTKALKTPKSCGRIRSAWIDFQIWWEDKIWWAYAPDWAKHIWWDIDRFYKDQISTRIRPRQKWLTKQIPRSWNDKVTLIPDVLYAMVIHFVDVDGEDCFNVTDFAASGLEEEEKMLRQIYAWAKTGRAEFAKRIGLAYPELPKNDKGDVDLNAWCNQERTPESYERDYGEVSRLEAELEKRDTEYLRWIVTNRRIMWC